MIPRNSILPRTAALCLVFVSIFGWGSVHAAGGLLLFTANGSPYVNAVVYETFSSPTAHLSYITVKGGGRTQVQSQGIIANLPFPTGSNVSPDDAASIILQTEAYAARYPQHAQLLNGVGELWKRKLEASKVEAAKLEQSRAAAVSPAATASQPGQSFVAPGLETVIPLIRTKTGQQFKNARVTRFENDQASVSHADGVTKVSLTDISNLPSFPPDVRAAVEKVRVDFQMHHKVEEDRRLAQLECDRKNKAEQARVVREETNKETALIQRRQEAKTNEEMLAKQKERAALDAFVDCLFGTPISMTALTEFLSLAGFTHEALKNTSGNVFQHFVNTRLDFEINAEGDDEIKTLSISQKTGRLDKLLTIEGHALFRDIVSFIVPTGGQWVFSTFPKLILRPEAELITSRRFGGFTVAIEAERSALPEKFSGLSAYIKWNPDSQSGNTCDKDRLSTFVLEKQTLERLKALSGERNAVNILNDTKVSVLGREDEENRSFNSVNYIDSHKVFFQLKKEKMKNIWEGGFLGSPPKLKPTWVDSKSICFWINIEELPQFVTILSEYEKFRLLAANEKLISGVERKLGSLAFSDITFITPDILRIGDTLNADDVFLVRQLVASLPELKNMIEHAVYDCEKQKTDAINMEQQEKARVLRENDKAQRLLNQ